MVAAEREEVQVAALLVTMESARHGGLEYRGLVLRAVMAGSRGFPRLQNRETWGTQNLCGLMLRAGARRETAHCGLFFRLRHTESAPLTAAP
jgi:hypothetical protein